VSGERQVKQWSRWAGEWADLMLAVDVATNHVAAPGKHPSVTGEVAIGHRTRTFDNREELVGAVDTRDIGDVKSIRIDIARSNEARITIHAEKKAPAMTLEVEGRDTTWVEGVYHKMQAELDRKSRRPNSTIVTLLELGGAAAGAVLAVYGALAIGLVSTEGGKLVSTGLPGLSLIVILTITVAVVFFAVAYLLPDLELVESDAPTRLVRYWRWALPGGIGVILVGLVVAALTKWLGLS
jgi:hypothetical protein